MYNQFLRTLGVTLFLFAYSINTSFCQNTVATIYQDSTLQDGYTLFFPEYQPDVFLIDPCGQIVNKWEGNDDFAPGFSVYLTKEGNLVKASRPNTDPAGTTILGSGNSGYVEIFDWDNNLIWSYSQIIGERRLHHDIEPLPNGNILMNAWERITLEDALALGRDPETLVSEDLYDEVIYEVNPLTDEIVWEWKASDHLIQTYNTVAPNWVGSPSFFFHRIDLNYVGDSNRKNDWLHINSIDYNEELDQIMISCPSFGEFWIIDHSTTTAEAAESTGGKSGKGGDLLYRWGNPEAYSAGEVGDKKLFYQHATEWISGQLSDGSQKKGEVILFNNRLAGYSSVQTLTLPTFDSLTWNYEKTEATYGPLEIDRDIKHPTDSTIIYSTIMSSGQMLDNGNVLICSAVPGTFVEITPQNTVAWEYVIPLEFGNSVSQGSEISSTANLIFKAEKYPPTFAGFINKDLSAKGYIEIDPDTTFCSMIDTMVMDTMMIDTMMIDTMMIDTMVIDTMIMDTMTMDTMMGVRTFDLDLLADITLQPNPTRKAVNIEWTLTTISYQVIGVDGQVQDIGEINPGRNTIDVEDLSPGIYLLRLGSYGAKKFIKLE